MKTKAIVPVSVVLVVLLFLAILLIVSRKPLQDITIRHVKSVQSGDITTMTFEIKNHPANTYTFFRPYEVQVRNGNAWTKFQGVGNLGFGASSYPIAGPGLVYCTVNVTNLPAKSVVRFIISSSKKLLGLSGLFRRAELNLKLRRKNLGRFAPSLNPYDTNSPVFGKTTEVTSDEFVETVK